MHQNRLVAWLTPDLLGSTQRGENGKGEGREKWWNERRELGTKTGREGDNRKKGEGEKGGNCSVSSKGYMTSM